MKKHNGMTDGEKLLAQALEECLEEDLSFVPPEREIARTHHFTKAFEEKLREMLFQTPASVRRRHFSVRYGYLAACVLVFCVCGVLFFNILQPGRESSMDGGGYSGSSDTASRAEVTEGCEPEETAEESAGDEGSVTEDTNAKVAAEEEYSRGNGESTVEYCGRTLYPAERQEIPESLDYATALVNCPVQDEENPAVYLTIGNTGTETLKYLDVYELEVWLEGRWYVIPSRTERTGRWMELEAGMAVDEEIDLENYSIDYDAQRYRLTVRVNDDYVGTEFTFSEVFSKSMENPEGIDSSGE